jgi:hypothetical protein
MLRIKDVTALPGLRLRLTPEAEQYQFGDTSTLADPAVVMDLVDNRMNRG